jgi:hypothetical protein
MHGIVVKILDDVELVEEIGNHRSQSVQESFGHMVVENVG